MANNWKKIPETDPRDIRITIDIPTLNQPLFIQPSQIKVVSEQNKKKIRQWLVQVYETITSDAFYRFENHQLTESQVKAYTAKNILLNIQIFMTETKNKYKYDDNFQTVLYIHLQNESTQILKNVILKYPQATAKQGARKLKQEISEIDVRESDEFDLLHNFKIQFKQKDSDEQNYYSEIMQILNHTMNIANQKLLKDEKQIMTNFEGFEKIMENILSYSGCPGFNNIFMGCVKEYAQSNNKTVENLLKLFDVNQKLYTMTVLSQYHSKQKTKIKINQKIPPNIKNYTEEQIKQGIMSIDDGSILRVLTKWAEELEDKINKPEEHIRDKVQAFKNNQGELMYLESSQKNYLYGRGLPALQMNIKEILRDLKNHSGQLCSKLTVIKEQTPYKNNVDGNLGLLAERIQGGVANYLLIYLNHLINKIINHPNSMNSIIANKYSSSLKQQILSVNLVTLKIGDLMRCNCKGTQAHIIQVYKMLMFMTKQCPEVIKIIRVKNRLNEKDNDLLINVFFMNKVQCQIQLQVSSRTLEPKQEKFNSFNHLIYELSRSKFGPIAQCASLVSQYDPVIKDLIKRRNKPNKPIEFQQYSNKQGRDRDTYATYLPFFCKGCTQFKKLTNSAFYEKAYKQNYCNSCYEEYQLKGDSKKYIDELFRYQNTKTIAMIKQHFQFVDISKLQQPSSIWHLKGYMFLKTKSKPEPQFCQFQRGDEIKLYALTNNKINSPLKFSQLKEEEKIGKIILQCQIPISKEEDEDYIRQIFKNILFFRMKRNAQLIEKINNQTQRKQKYLECTCCPLKNLYLFSQYLLPFEHIHKKKNKKIIKETYEKKKTGLILSNKGLTDELTNNQFDLSSITRLEINQNPNIKNPQTLLQKCKFTKLQILNLSQCGIFEISQWGIQLLQKLQYLKLSRNKIQSIKHFQNIKNLKALERLDLDNNKIQKIEGLNYFINLTELHLDGNKIKVIQNIQHLLLLESLFLQHNFIEQITNLKKLKKLKELNLKGNKIGINNFHNIENQFNTESILTISLKSELLRKSDVNVARQLQRIKQLPNVKIKVTI